MSASETKTSPPDLTVREGESLLDRLGRVSRETEGHPILLGEGNWLRSATETNFIRDAINRAFQLYEGTGDVQGALMFIAVACCPVKPSAEALAWATEEARRIADAE